MRAAGVAPGRSPGVHRRRRQGNTVELAWSGQTACGVVRQGKVESGRLRLARGWRPPWRECSPGRSCRVAHSLVRDLRMVETASEGTKESVATAGLDRTNCSWAGDPTTPGRVSRHDVAVLDIGAISSLDDGRRDCRSRRGRRAPALRCCRRKLNWEVSGRENQGSHLEGSKERRTQEQFRNVLHRLSDALADRRAFRLFSLKLLRHFDAPVLDRAFVVHWLLTYIRFADEGR